MVNGNSVRLELSADLGLMDLVGAVAEQFGQHVGLDEDGLHWVTVAVREAAINAIKHGNAGDRTTQVSIQFTAIEGPRPGVEVRVRDQGQGFDPESLPNPLAEENLLKPCGRGIFLIRSFMDDLRFDRTDAGGTELVMVKRVPENNEASTRPSSRRAIPRGVPVPRSPPIPHTWPRQSRSWSLPEPCSDRGRRPVFVSRRRASAIS